MSAGWEHAVFSLLAPDTFRRHLAGAVLDRLAAGGLRVTGWAEVLITGREIDAVAQIQHVGAGAAFRYRALDAIFALGPAVALRLADTAGRAPADLYREVKALKGASMPADTVPGTIRYDLGSVNAVLSLLHVSDSPANAARESAAVLRGDPDGPPVDDLLAPAASLPGYLLAREAGGPAETRGHREVVAAVRGRVLARLWAVLPEDVRAEATRLLVGGGLGEPAAGPRLAAGLLLPGPAGPPAAGRDGSTPPAVGRDGLAPPVVGRDGLAAPVGGGAPGGGLGELVGVLGADFEPGAGAPDPAELDLLLRRHRIGLDAWEHVVLATSRYFAARALERTRDA